MLVIERSPADADDIGTSDGSRAQLRRAPDCRPMVISFLPSLLLGAVRRLLSVMVSLTQHVDAALFSSLIAGFGRHCHDDLPLSYHFLHIVDGWRDGASLPWLRARAATLALLTVARRRFIYGRLSATLTAYTR